MLIVTERFDEMLKVLSSYELSETVLGREVEETGEYQSNQRK